MRIDRDRHVEGGMLRVGGHSHLRRMPTHGILANVAETEATRVGSRKLQQADNRLSAVFCVRTLSAFYGRALVRERLRSPGPVAPVFQPCHVPGHPVWKRGAGFFNPQQEAAQCVHSLRSPVLGSRAASLNPLSTPPCAMCSPATSVHWHSIRPTRRCSPLRRTFDRIS